MRAKKSRGRKIPQQGMDRPLFFAVFLLSLFGVLMVFSASAPYALKQFGDATYYFKRDVIFSVLGIAVMLLFSKINYRIYRRFALAIWVIAFLSCFLVYAPVIGLPINNAHRWIHLGPITYMPSDGLKIASILFLSDVLGRKKLEQNGTFRMLVFVGLFVLVTIAPIFIQPNFSAVIVIAASLLFLYFIGGMKLTYLIPIVIVGALGLWYAFRPHPGNYRLERLLTVFDPTRDPTGSGWQLLQSLYAVASGGLFGVGYGQSRQKFDYLADEPHNDFIFAVISEELGFVGACLVVIAFVFIAWRGFRIAKRACTPFGRLVAYGLTFLISFQAMVNIGVSIGVVPTTGITLPFVSYGGSSLIIMSVVAGILLNISRDRGRSVQDG